MQKMNIFRLFTNRRKKATAITLLGVFLCEIIAPNVALALTAGPTSPEATSFEPVDTTDMVNPLTGSFTYNMPLLEVPGPEGGYPLSLAYHAGISPNLEASWVGLGWTLNPGAINRNVNGFPDDFSNVSLKRRDYWSGGNRKDFGLSVGFANTVNLGLTFSQDTYRGFGVGASIGLGASLLKFGSKSIGIGGDIGANSYGESFGSAGLYASTPWAESKSIRLGAGIGISTNFNSIAGYAGGGISATAGSYNQSVLGASISTTGGKPSLTVGGGWANIGNANAGRIQTRSKGFGFTIPLPVVSIGLSYRYTRYWSDETAQVLTNGTQWIPQTIANQSDLNSTTYDIYRLANHPEQNIVDHPDENQLQGGTYPDFDNYSVVAQGLGGNMRPHIFQSTLYSQNINSEFVPLTGSTGSFGNMESVGGIGFRFLNDFSNSYRQENTNSISGSWFPFAAPVHGNGDGDYGYNNITLTGSKHVEYFTNEQIGNGIAKGKGFRDYNGNLIRLGKTGSLSNTRGNLQIGGFMITNESGVTYHFALPVYSFNEFSKTISDDGTKYSSTTRNEPYAYTWLLTAVTGPDYVDRDGDGKVSAGDWGYWVAFEYNKTPNNYNWRTPAKGFNADLEQGYKSYSKGTKELYYLRRISTRSHVALFDTQERIDGRGSIASTANPDEGRFDYQSSSKSRRLNKIYLLDVANAAVTNPTEMEAKAIRIIDFNYDYSLVKKTPNSVDLGSDQQPQASGKLTLKNVLIRGKGGVRLIPPTEFEYESKILKASGNLTETTFTSASGNFNVGDLVETDQRSAVFCGIIAKKALVNGQYVYNLVNSDQWLNANNITLRTTKNPPYLSEGYDNWNMYKADIDRDLLKRNPDLARTTTPLSALAADVWSLRKIKTPLGGEINVTYESNDYSKVVYKGNRSLAINQIQKVSNTELNLSVFNNGTEAGITPGSVLDVLFLMEKQFTLHPSPNIRLEHAVIRTNSTDKKFTCLSAGEIANNMQTIRVQTSPETMNAIYYGRSTTGINYGDTTYNTGSLVKGNIRVTNAAGYAGAGIRAKALAVDALDGSVLQTVYDYTNPSMNQSSGITSYEPTGLEPDDILEYVKNMGEFTRSEVKKLYRRELLKSVPSYLTNAREVPAPGVMYQFVTIKNQTIKDNGDSFSEGKSTYQYRVFEEKMLEKTLLFSNVNATRSEKNLAYRDLTANIGDLLSVSTYDKYNKLLSKKINSYLYDEVSGADQQTFTNNYTSAMGTRFSYQGMIQERYGDGRSFVRSGLPTTYTVTMSARQHYPSVLTKQTDYDYLTNTSTLTENVAYDFYSGSLTRSRTRDSYGNRFETEVYPAYRQYAGMGLKTAVATNKHMLAQEAGSVTYKLSGSNIRSAVVSANAQVWSNANTVLVPDGTTLVQNNTASNNTVGSVWRVRQSYNWLSTAKTADGMTTMANFSMFNFATPASSNANWKQVSEMKRYDVYSKVWESTDINGQYSTTRYGYNHSKAIISGFPAGYYELAFGSVEDETINGNAALHVLKGDGVVTTAAAHTGSASLSLANGKSGFVYTVPVSNIAAGRSYTASVWVRPVSGSASDVKLYYQINGTTKSTSASSSTSNKKSGVWTLVTMEIKGADIVSGATLKIACRNDHATEVYVDDFRFQPSSTTATAYVYDKQSGELTHVLDNNNLYTRYEYDGIGALKAVHAEQFGRNPFKVSEHQQHYRPYVYKSNEVSKSFTKNNCPTGSASIPVNYIVPAGAYTSTVSQEDADSKALVDVQNNGQNYANANSTCETVQRNIISGYYRKDNPCLNGGEVFRQIYIDQSVASQISFIQENATSATNIVAYVNSVGNERVAPGWYKGLYSALGDGNFDRVYEVDTWGEITRYTLCPKPTPPASSNQIDLVVTQVGPQREITLMVYMGSAQPNDIVINGRSTLLNNAYQEIYGGSTFSVTIPAGTTVVQKPLYINLNTDPGPGASIELRQLSSSNPNFQLKTNRYFLEP